MSTRTDRHRFRNYNITPTEYQALLKRLDGRCAICRNPPPRKMGLCVDHDHTTGRVRGILCHKCNSALGMFGDDTATLRRAIAYLIDPPALTSVTLSA